MSDKKKEAIKPPEGKKSTVPLLDIRLNPSSAKLGFIYAELLGPPVSKRRRAR